jgi:hypothetical protein
MSDIVNEAVSPSEGELFRKILGDEWKKLHPDIKARFAKNPEISQPLYYKGKLSELSNVLIGYIHANQYNSLLI